MVQWMMNKLREPYILPFNHITNATPDDRDYYYWTTENDGLDTSNNGLLALESKLLAILFHNEFTISDSILVCRAV